LPVRTGSLTMPMKKHVQPTQTMAAMTHMARSCARSR
jgi:hypothetical protein